MNSKTNKGITLIALVITIIVLLILAGVTINMVLGDDGIIKNAQAAKELTETASDEEAVAIAKAEAALAKYAGQTAMSYAEAKETFTTLTEDTYKNNLAKVIDEVPIPLGFAHVAGTTKDEGLVIVDGVGNEFVWVPVENPSTFTTLTKGWYKGSEQTWVGREPRFISDSQADGDPTNTAAILETDKYSDLNTQFTTEYNNMVESVNKYKGFYVGRYETSWTGSKVASVSGVVPMTPATLLEDTWKTRFESNANKATWYGLYAKQKELYNKESDSVVSGMIYGCEWDAIMNWMKDVPNPNVEGGYYIKNSTGMGWYFENRANNPTHITGLDINGTMNKVKNIYDLAGNFVEFTQEAERTKISRILRGGFYAERATEYSASSRAEYQEGSNGSRDFFTSRLQLYIK